MTSAAEGHIPVLLNDLRTYNFDEIINYCEGKVANARDSQALQRANSAVQGYVIKAASAIAENILDIGAELTAYLESQDEQVTEIGRKMKHLSTRIRLAESQNGAIYTTSQRRARKFPSRQMREKVLTGDSLPFLAVPRKKYVQKPIDLTYLSQLGMPGGPTSLPDSAPGSFPREESQRDAPDATGATDNTDNTDAGFASLDAAVRPKRKSIFDFAVPETMKEIAVAASVQEGAEEAEESLSPKTRDRVTVLLRSLGCKQRFRGACQSASVEYL